MLFFSASARDRIHGKSCSSVVNRIVHVLHLLSGCIQAYNSLSIPKSSTSVMDKRLRGVNYSISIKPLQASVITNRKQANSCKTLAKRQD